MRNEEANGGGRGVEGEGALWGVGGEELADLQGEDDDPDDVVLHVLKAHLPGAHKRPAVDQRNVRQQHVPGHEACAGHIHCRHATPWSHSPPSRDTMVTLTAITRHHGHIHRRHATPWSHSPPSCVSHIHHQSRVTFTIITRHHGHIHCHHVTPWSHSPASCDTMVTFTIVT